MTEIALLGVSVADVQAIAIGVFGFIGALGLAVFVHELGHFLAAKLFKVPVERFVIGFDKEAMGFLPRCIWERKIGETTYGLSLIPLGGYVKMVGTVHPEIEKYLEGEDEKSKAKPTGDNDPALAGESISAGFERVRASGQKKNETPSLQEQALTDIAALYKKPYWQKVIIYAAGVVMNIVLAMVATAIMFSVGFNQNAPFEAKIAWMSPENPYRDGVIKPGDHIVAVNGNPIKDQSDLDRELFNAADGKMIGEELESLTVSLTLAPGEAPEDPSTYYTYDLTIQGDDEGWTHFTRTFFYQAAYVDFVLPNTPADKAGIKKGDEIVAIDGRDIADWAEFSYIISHSPKKELALRVKRGDGLVDLKATPWADADNPERGQIGVIAGNSEKKFVQEPFFKALVMSPELVYNQTTNYVSRLGQLGGKLVRGNVTAVSREIGGPVGIAQIAYKMAQNGFTDWLRFLIMLNIALAVMNILPFPILDGGHIVFASFEAVFRRPVPARVIVPLLNGAMIFLMVFFVLVTFNDVRKLFF